MPTVSDSLLLALCEAAAAATAPTVWDALPKHAHQQALQQRCCQLTHLVNIGYNAMPKTCRKQGAQAVLLNDANMHLDRGRETELGQCVVAASMQQSQKRNTSFMAQMQPNLCIHTMQCMYVRIYTQAYRRCHPAYVCTYMQCRTPNNHVPQLAVCRGAMQDAKQGSSRLLVQPSDVTKTVKHKAKQSASRVCCQPPILRSPPYSSMYHKCIAPCRKTVI